MPGPAVHSPTRIVPPDDGRLQALVRLIASGHALQYETAPIDQVPMRVVVTWTGQVFDCTVEALSAPYAPLANATPIADCQAYNLVAVYEWLYVNQYPIFGFFI
jgi:hypothetical protein